MTPPGAGRQFDGDASAGGPGGGGALPGAEGVLARLGSVAEELADLALQRLQQAVDDDAGAGRLAAEERRITRARRAVERAVAILGGSADD